MSLSKALKRANRKRPIAWKGPEVAGVSQSLLSRYLTCKERFRIKTIEGLKPVQQFFHRGLKEKKEHFV